MCESFLFMKICATLWFTFEVLGNPKMLPLRWLSFLTGTLDGTILKNTEWLNFLYNKSKLKHVTNQQWTWNLCLKDKIKSQVLNDN